MFGGKEIRLQASCRKLQALMGAYYRLSAFTEINI